MTKFFEIFGKVSLVLLILGSLTYVGFYFGSKSNVTPKQQDKLIEKTQEVTDKLATPSPTTNIKQEFTVSAGVAKSAGLSFDQYSIMYPENWKVEKTSQTAMDERLAITSNGYEVNIFQGATGGALCLYPGDPDFEGPSSKYEAFIEYKTKDNRSVRRSGAKIVSNVEPISFTVCQKSPDGSYQQPTNYGHISVKLPANWDQSKLDEIDKIISSLKKI